MISDDQTPPSYGAHYVDQSERAIRKRVADYHLHKGDRFYYDGHVTASDLTEVLKLLDRARAAQLAAETALADR